MGTKNKVVSLSPLNFPYNLFLVHLFFPFPGKWPSKKTIELQPHSLRARKRNGGGGGDTWQRAFLEINTMHKVLTLFTTLLFKSGSFQWFIPLQDQRCNSYGEPIYNLQLPFFRRLNGKQGLSKANGTFPGIALNYNWGRLLTTVPRHFHEEGMLNQLLSMKRLCSPLDWFPKNVLEHTGKQA